MLLKAVAGGEEEEKCLCGVILLQIREFGLY
jgi:hypothetical protein